MNGTDVITSGSSVCDESVSVDVYSRITATRTYRFNSGNWYSFSNNTSFSQIGYYEIYAENTQGGQDANFTILPPMGVGEVEFDEIYSYDENAENPVLLSTRVISKIEYYPESGAATYSTTNIWDMMDINTKRNLALYISWPSEQVNELTPSSQNVRVETHFTYSGTFVSTTNITDAILYSSTDDRFIDVQEGENLQQIDMCSIAFRETLPYNEYEDNYTLGTITVREYSYVEYKFSVDVQCNSQFIAGLSPILEMHSTFSLIETITAFTPAQLWKSSYSILITAVGFLLLPAATVGYVITLVLGVTVFMFEDSDNETIEFTNTALEYIWTYLEI